MKRKGLVIAFGTGVVSIALHAGGFVALSSAFPQNLAGGPPQHAMIGNSFEDAVAGAIASTTNPVLSLPTETFTPLAGGVTPAPAPAARTRDAARPAPSATAAAAATISHTAAPVLRTATPVAATRPASISAVQPDATATAHRPTVSRAAAPTSITRIAAQEVPINPASNAPTIRPVARPHRAKSKPTSQQNENASPSQPPLVPKGSAEETTRAGDPSGATQGKATRSQQGQAGQSASTGKAAAQYPQLVNRHLSRLRRPNARFNGATVVSFTIAETGLLAAVRVARSSGSTRFDQLALAHIQRAAPFPTPPAGAQRQFNVTIRSR